MQVAELLDLEHISCNTQSASKKRVLEQLSQLLVTNQESVSRNQVFDSLLSRERLGSTGLGHGVAIPHGRVKGTTSVEASFIRLRKPLPFDAIDGEPVDLLFALAVPEACSEDHLKLLSQVAELFSDEALLNELRQAKNPAKLLELLSGSKH